MLGKHHSYTVLDRPLFRFTGSEHVMTAFTTVPVDFPGCPVSESQDIRIKTEVPTCS